MPVAAYPAGVAGAWGQAGVPGEVVGGGERCHVSAGGGEEFGAGQRPDAGHAGDHLGQFVAGEPVFDECLGVFDLFGECQYVLGEFGRRSCGHVFAGQDSGLGLGCADDTIGQVGGSFAYSVVSELRGQLFWGQSAEGGGGCWRR